MILSNLKATVFTALAAVTLLAPSAKAALTYSSDDLFIGFRQAGNNVTDYAINIGQASIYRDSTASFTLTLNGLANDLTAAFGSNWASAGNITWGIVGTTQNSPVGSDGVRLLYISEITGANIPISSSAQSSPATNILNFKNNWITQTQGTVPNSAIEDASVSNSWNARIQTAFGSNNLNPIEGPLSSTLDLFRLPQSSNQSLVTNEGTFGFDLGTGTVTFTSSSFTAVPEPATAIIGIALLGVATLNRRRTTASA